MSEEYPLWEQCWDGAKFMWVPGAFIGAKYGDATGKLGAFSQGHAALGVRVLTTAKATVYGAAITTAAGCLGNIALQNLDVAEDFGEAFCRTAPDTPLPIHLCPEKSRQR